MEKTEDIAPLTRDEIKLLLDMNGYPTSNPFLLEQIVKLVRLFERDGYGISFDEATNANSMVNRR